MIFFLLASVLIFAAFVCLYVATDSKFWLLAGFLCCAATIGAGVYDHYTTEHNKQTLHDLGIRPVDVNYSTFTVRQGNDLLVCSISGATITNCRVAQTVIDPETLR